MLNPFAVLLVLGLAVLLIASAEIARTVVARLVGLERRRNRFYMLDVRGRGRRGKRLAAIAIGPIGGYLAIAILAMFLYRCHGAPSDNLQTVAKLTDDSVVAGIIEPGDRIVEVEGEPFVGGPLQLHDALQRLGGAPVRLTIERGEEQRAVQVAPMLSTRPGPDGKSFYLLGIRMQHDLVIPGIGTSLVLALQYPYRQGRIVLRGMYDLVFGDEEADPGGPVRISAEMRAGFENGPASLLQLAMMLGVYLLFALVGFDLVRAIIVLVRR